MREITTHRCGRGMDKQVFMRREWDEPGAGGACHEYSIQVGDSKQSEVVIRFQKGPVAETGPNGLSCESLLAVVLDRLESFQNGPYPCSENAQALTRVRDAMYSLQNRTLERARRSVEGTTNA